MPHFAFDAAAAIKALPYPIRLIATTAAAASVGDRRPSASTAAASTTTSLPSRSSDAPPPARTTLAVVTRDTGALLTYAHVEDTSEDEQQRDGITLVALDKRPGVTLKGAAAVVLLGDRALLVLDAKKNLVLYDSASNSTRAIAAKCTCVAASRALRGWLVCAAVNGGSILQKYHINGTTIEHVQDIQLPFSPSALLLDGSMLYGALRARFFRQADARGVTEIQCGYIFQKNSGRSLSSSSSLSCARAALPGKLVALTCGRLTMSYSVATDTVEEKTITWSKAPRDIATSHPYILASLADSIEVKDMYSGATVQSIQIPGMNAFSRMFVAGDDCVWKLTQVSVDNQVEDLIEQGEFTTAIALVTHSTELSEAEQREMVYNVRVMRGEHMFFSERRFDDAIVLFQELDFPPAEVIDLFPMLKTSDLSLPEQGEGPTLDEASYKTALRALQTYLLDFRLKINVLRRQQQRTSMPVEQAEIDYLASMIDTALLKVYLLTNPRLVMSLLRVDNHCDLDVSESLLARFGKMQELIELYFGKGCHRRALEHLTQDAADNEKIVAYLRRLGEKHVDLLLEFSTAVVVADPARAVDIFSESARALSLLARERVLIHLEYVALDGAILYLEYVIGELREEDASLHNKLAVWYLRKVVDCRGDAAWRDKLRAFLHSSRRYQAAKVLKAFPKDDTLINERTILLGRMRRHDEALDLILTKLRDVDYAQEYCKINTTAEPHPDDKDDPTQNNVYMVLLKKLVSLTTDLKTPLPEVTHDFICDFITRNAGALLYINDVLPLLPQLTQPSAIGGYLVKSTQLMNKQDKHNAVLSNILKRAGNKVKRDTAVLELQRVVISDDRMCVRCFKRIGNSVFACSPDNEPEGSLVHYGCL